MPPQNNQPNPQPGALPSPVTPVAPPHPGPQTEQPAPIAAPNQAADVRQDFPPNSAPKEEANRYAFFMEAKPKSKTSLIPLPKKESKFAWIIIGAITLFLILIVLAVISNIARSSQTTGDAGTLTGIINQQQEIIRVNSLASNTVQSANLVNFVTTAIITTTSSQQELISYATQHGVKIDSGKLALYKASGQTDTVLASAQAASVYDTTFQRVMLDIITKYQASLQGLADKTTAPNEKAIITKDLDGAKLLQTMIAAP